MALQANSWICCPQLPYHPSKNGTHSTCFCSTTGHTPRVDACQDDVPNSISRGVSKGQDFNAQPLVPEHRDDPRHHTLFVPTEGENLNKNSSRTVFSRRDPAKPPPPLNSNLNFWNVLDLSYYLCVFCGIKY